MAQSEEKDEKLSKPLMVRLDVENSALLEEMAEITGNTPSAMARLAVKAMIKSYEAAGRKITFPMEMVFLPTENLPMAAEEQAPYRSRKDRPA